MAESTRLLKAEAARGLGSKIAFNYDDLQRRCQQQLDGARQQSEQILAAAEAHGAELRRQAFDEGRAAGEQAGLESARDLIEARAREIATQQVQEELRAAMPALQSAIAEIRYERDRWLSAWEEAAIRLSAAIAGKIVRRELQNCPALTTGIVRDALELAAGTPQMRVRMNPLDVAQMGQSGQDIISRLESLGEAALVPDDTVTQGGCVIETRHGVIDAQVESQLERIAAELIQT